MSSQNIIEKAAGAVKWSALMEIMSRLVSPLVMIVLARLLTPNDFGVVAVAMIAISFSGMFWEAGLGRALIQTKEDASKAANIVFWSNLVLALIAYLILVIASPWLAVFFKCPSAEKVLKVLGLMMPLTAITIVQQSLLQKQISFKKLFWIKFFTIFIPGLFSIPLAFIGWGVWALVAGTLAGSLANCILHWIISPWRPSFTYDWKLAKKLMLFSMWVLGESLAAWFLTWGDNFIVGRFLSVEDLGVYRLAFTMSVTVYATGLNPIVNVLYPAFSRMQDDTESLAAIFKKSNWVIFMIAIPISVGFLFLSPEISKLLFGAKWANLGFVLGVMGFMHGICWIVGLNPELYRATGRPDLNTKLMFIAIAYYLPAFLISAQHGLQAFTLTRLAVALTTIPIHVALAVWVLKLKPLYLWHDGKHFFISAAVMAGVMFWIKSVGLNILKAPLIVNIIVLTVSALISYSFVLLMLDKNIISKIRVVLIKSVK